jgi:hypothetical protein
MKKSKLLVLGLIALMLAGRLVLATCEIKESCHGEKDCIHSNKDGESRVYKYESCGYSSCAVYKSAGSDSYWNVYCDCK